MYQTVEYFPLTIRCVICLCSPSTMLSFDTPIDVEGIQMCCGAMYRKFIWIEASAMANIRRDQLKLCLSCFTQLNTCYLFQRKARKSAEHLSIIKRRNWDESFVLEGSKGKTKCDETIDNFIDEGRNVHQNEEDNSMESLDGSASAMKDGENTLHEIDTASLVQITKEEYIVELDELVQPDAVIDEASTASTEVHVLEEQAEEIVILTSVAEETDVKCPRNTEQGEDGPLIMVRGAEERAIQCTRCTLGMDTMTSFREHFIEDHCLKESESTQMQCTECKRNFKGRKSFIQHLVIHQVNKPYVCRVCAKSFYYAHHQRKHELTHSKERPFRCERCPKTFTNKQNLDNHLFKHEAQANYVCNVCPSRFKSPKALHSHKLIKHDAEIWYFKPYACEKCGKMLHSQTAASYHAKQQCDRIALGPVSLYITCLVCKQHFPTRAQLERHLQTQHTAEEHRSYIRQNIGKTSANECDVCGRTFSQRVILMRHKLRHEGIKPYQCAHCKRSFAQKGTLKTHIRTHTDERPFLCAGCGDSFRSAGSLRCHRMRRCANRELKTLGNK
uniref:C2H2-type domain-containing protein n=1 Tax=Anopheles atroparvus TaxID=41427 RepID=A0AAG5CPW1_ANOAO